MALESRRPVLAAALAGSATTLAVWVVVVGPVPGERWLLARTHDASGEAVDRAALVTSRLTDLVPLCAVAALVTAALLLAGRRLDAAYLVAACSVVWAVNPVLQQIAGRSRPDLWPLPESVSEYGFPSGHAANTTALVGGLLLVVHGRPRVLTMVTGAAVVATAGLAQLVLGRHYPSDVLGGWLWAGAWVLLVGWAAGRDTRHRQVIGDSLTDMTDPAAWLRRIDAANERLLATTQKVTDDDVHRPSLLPGWSVGHVLTHIARNADSLVNLATWARTGVKTPQYASPEARDADIEAGAYRPAAALAEDIASSNERLRVALETLPPEAWSVEVEWRGGRRKPATHILSARLTEVEVHHVDLGLWYGFGDIPEDLRLQLLADAVAGFPESDGVVVEASDAQVRLPAGLTPKITVIGSSGELLGWASGRTTGERLRCDGPLPVVPEWR